MQMPPTRLLYWQDSYLRRFDALLLRAELDEKRFFYLILDATVFHPKMGGQPSDRGTLCGSGFSIEVKKVMQVRDVLVHWGKAREGAPSACRVEGELDWPWRYLLMRRHTAGHLLDHCLGLVSGKRMETLGSWLGEGCYVQYRGAVPDTPTLKAAEDLQRKMIAEGAPVTVEHVSSKELLMRAPDAPNLYRLPALGTYRIVTIQGYAPIPCSGTHLRDIKEIGGFHVKEAVPVEQGFRVYYDLTPTG